MGIDDEIDEDYFRGCEETLREKDQGCMNCGQCQSCIDRSIAAHEENEPMPLSRAPFMGPIDFMEWASKHGISLPTADVNACVEYANLDEEEGVEWLPFYKASLGFLSELAGYMGGIIERTALAVKPEQLAEMKRLWLLHLLLAGIGPDQDAGRAAALKIKAIRDTDECFSGLEVQAPTVVETHYHEASNDGTDRCKKCGLDLRDDCHTRG